MKARSFLVLAFSVLAFGAALPVGAQNSKAPALPRSEKVVLREVFKPNGQVMWRLEPMRRPVSEILRALASAEDKDAVFDPRLTPEIFDWFAPLEAPTIDDLIAQIANYANWEVVKSPGRYFFTAKKPRTSPPPSLRMPAPLTPQFKRPNRRDEFNFGPADKQDSLFANSPFLIRPEGDFFILNPVPKMQEQLRRFEREHEK